MSGKHAESLINDKSDESIIDVTMEELISKYLTVRSGKCAISNEK